MKNRAKCKLCSSVVESFFDGDVIYCKCGKIAVMDGLAMRTYAENNDYSIFLRVDDLGNEIVVKYEGAEKGIEQPQEPLRKKDLLGLLQDMIDNEEKLPIQAKEAHLNTYDLLRYMILIKQIFERGDSHD